MQQSSATRERIGAAAQLKSVAPPATARTTSDRANSSMARRRHQRFKRYAQVARYGRRTAVRRRAPAAAVVVLYIASAMQLFPRQAEAAQLSHSEAFECEAAHA